MAYYRAGALDVLMAEVNKLWPHRDKTSDGWIGDTSHQARPSDHNPDWSAGGIVRAQDIDEDLVANLTATGEAMPLVNAIIRDVRTRYVIYEGRIWTRENGWQPYYGVNAHRHHIHVSVRSINGYDRDRSPWNLAARMGNTISGGWSVTIPSLPGKIPAAPKEWLDMVDEATLRKIVREEAAKGVYVASAATGKAFIRDAVWKAPIVDQSDGRAKTAETYLSYQGKAFSGTRDALLAAVKSGGVDPKTIAAELGDVLGPDLAGQVVTELSKRLGA